MTLTGTMDWEKPRRDRVKNAVSLAMQGRWSEAAMANQLILEDSPDDLEAYNRLGKSLAEQGRLAAAKDAFSRALDISPHNAIARKNLDRLLRLGNDAPRSGVKSNRAWRAFIEESGKAGVTSLINLSSPKLLLKMSPGHQVRLRETAGGLKVEDSGGEYLGQVEPRLASRLARLSKGGNRYEATVTSVGETELTVIIREAYQHPSQAGIVSFPSRGVSDHRAHLPGAVLGFEFGDEETQDADATAVKDWSDDDTEPGDDDAFSPVIHRIINTGENGASDGDDA